MVQAGDGLSGLNFLQDPQPAVADASTSPGPVNRYMHEPSTKTYYLQALSLACRISEALSYFSVDVDVDDETPSDGDDTPPHEPEPEPSRLAPAPAEIERNRKRFGFWHIARTNCFFRLTFGKSSLLLPGSWKVNFPDPTITGVCDSHHDDDDDDRLSQFVQIYFLVSMRVTLDGMSFLDGLTVILIRIRIRILMRFCMVQFLVGLSLYQSKERKCRYLEARSYHTTTYTCISDQ
ncbi:hypothetical protein BDV06DRAFT_125024 [Aspergillus oleicola]